MPDDTFAQIADEWIAAALRNSPAGATSLGIHDYDGELPDRSRASIEAHATRAARLPRAPRSDRRRRRSPRQERPEHELLRRRILWELVSIEELQTWRRSPGGYLGAIGGGCNGLIIRDFAPLAERAQSLVSRLRQAPRLLEQAKANLDGCPRIYVETAIEQAAGMRVLLQRDLPDALSSLDDASLRSQFEDAQRDALAAIESFAAWMKDDLLPRSDGGYAYGEDRYRKLLVLHRLRRPAAGGAGAARPGRPARLPGAAQGARRARSIRRSRRRRSSISSRRTTRRRSASSRTPTRCSTSCATSPSIAAHGHDADGRAHPRRRYAVVRAHDHAGRLQHARPVRDERRRRRTTT